MIIFGASGDLTRRKLLPALYNLSLDGLLPDKFSVAGFARSDMTVEQFREQALESVRQFSRRPVDPKSWDGFARGLFYASAGSLKTDDFHRLAKLMARADRERDTGGNRVFYLSVPPSAYSGIVEGLGASGLAAREGAGWARIIVEKPFGRDLDTARELNQELAQVFAEEQVYRIDHFLGKETVQNIQAMRFANPIFEPIWNRRYVDHVVVTVAETLGVEHRGRYYERAGALRDMVQNHLFQLLCLVAMEPPVIYDADDIRGKKVDVLRELRPIPPEAVHEFAARGQYGEGWIHGTQMPSYRAEPDVDPRSNTETYAALKLHVDNWRWHGVPFYLRTGKRMTADVSEISIRFRDVPHHAFPASVGLDSQPVRLVIQMQPEHGIVLKFIAKEPGSPLRLRPVDMRFSYKEAFQRESPAAYETLLWDVMIGDATLFMRSDQVESAWEVLMPVLEVWQNNPAPDFPNYAAGSWGPESAEALVARDGKSWLTPSLTHR